MAEEPLPPQEPEAPVAEPLPGEERPSPQTKQPAQDPNDRLMGALAYIVPVILPLVILFSETGKVRPFQRYHAVQSLALTVVSLVWLLLVFIATLILSGICAPLACLFGVLYLAPAVPAVWAAYRAYNGEWVEIPGLTQFLRDQKWL